MISGIFYDSREDIGRRNLFRSFFPDAVEKQLISSDYWFETTKGNVLFEYKTFDDFIGSIIDSRVFEQVNKMSAYSKLHFVIVEGSLWESLYEYHRSKFKYQHITADMVIGAVARLSLNTNVIFLPDEQSIFKFMKSTVDKFQTEQITICKSEIKSANTVANYLNCIKRPNGNRIGKKTCLNIVDDLNLHTLEDLFEVSKDELVKVKGVSSKTADLILRSVK